MSLQLPHRKSVSILLMSVVILQVGCRGWIEKPIVPDTGIAIAQRGLLRVTMTDGAVITLRDSFVTDDSIVGFFSADPLRRASIARSEVTKIEVRGDTTPRGVRIAGKVYLGVVLALGLVLAVTVIMYGNTASHLPH
jgi:hypothetical protein